MEWWSCEALKINVFHIIQVINIRHLSNKHRLRNWLHNQYTFRLFQLKGFTSRTGKSGCVEKVHFNRMLLSLMLKDMVVACSSPMPQTPPLVAKSFPNWPKASLLSSMACLKFQAPLCHVNKGDTMMFLLLQFFSQTDYAFVLTSKNQCLHKVFNMLSL